MDFAKTRLCRLGLLPVLNHNFYYTVFATASFVLGHYVKNFREVLKIGWLSINERKDFNLLK